MSLNGGGVPSRQDIQDAIDEVSEAGTWVSMTHAGTAGGVAYLVRAGHVTVRLSATIAVTSGGNATVVTAANALPAGLRPSAAVYAAAFSGNAVGYFVVNTDGSITAHASTAAMTSVGGIVTFPIG